MFTGPKKKPVEQLAKTRRTETREPRATKSGVISVCCAGVGALIPAVVVLVKRYPVSTWPRTRWGFSSFQSSVAARGTGHLAGADPNSQDQPSSPADADHSTMTTNTPPQTPTLAPAADRASYLLDVSGPYLATVWTSPRTPARVYTVEMSRSVSPGDVNIISSASLIPSNKYRAGAVAAKTGDCSDTARAHRRRER